MDQELLPTEEEWQRFEVEANSKYSTLDFKIELSRLLLNQRKLFVDSAKYLHIGLNPVRDFGVDIGIVGENPEIGFYFNSETFKLFTDILEEKFPYASDQKPVKIIVESVVVLVGVSYVSVTGKALNCPMIHLSRCNVKIIRNLKNFVLNYVEDLKQMSCKYLHAYNDVAFEIIKNHNSTLNNKVLLDVISAKQPFAGTVQDVAEQRYVWVGKMRNFESGAKTVSCRDNRPRQHR
ncbi:hypothetical protein FQR65_LT06271 [Abscondita terminalis]|nr:hypothetical protein FQR65_LT06271 [Abscondita terminalis]